MHLYINSPRVRCFCIHTTKQSRVALHNRRTQVVALSRWETADGRPKLECAHLETREPQLDRAIIQSLTNSILVSCNGYDRNVIGAKLQHTIKQLQSAGLYIIFYYDIKLSHYMTMYLTKDCSLS